ncbi:hypothetical protein [Piscinibacter sakaiensis]|uniref:hypothetical protein n=1 Tax=Piscinibacter sakaiensis TaxID=1547922 RepID=UPI003AAA4D4D
MNISHQQLAAIVLATFTTAASFAAGTDTPELSRVEIIRSSAEVEAARVVLATQAFRSAYQMETGERLMVDSRGSALRMRYADRPFETLRHDGNGRFVSADGRYSLRFALDQGGTAERVTLAMPAR